SQQGIGSIRSDALSCSLAHSHQGGAAEDVPPALRKASRRCSGIRTGLKVVMSTATRMWDVAKHISPSPARAARNSNVTEDSPTRATPTPISSVSPYLMGRLKYDSTRTVGNPTL